MNRLLLLFTFLAFASSSFAQNVNNTFRSKMTFSGQTLANIWGYVSPDGHEYALLGGSKGLIIVDVTDPDDPEQIVQIPGPNNLWKEIKTYQHYCYVVSEGGQGIQVFDLSVLPSPNVPNQFYSGDGAIAGQLTRIHALHIDTTKGYLYAWGGNLFGGGAKIFDIHTDPWNPTYVGRFDQLGYIHDGYVDNDTMYSGHIYAGQFAIVDVTDKSNPQLLATQTTPGSFTHNTWLTDDRRVLLTTDEVNNSVLAAYDVSDPEDIKFLDAVQSNPGSNSMVHNTHILGNYAVTSWYRDGFTIVDITHPDNLVQVGNYDTYPGIGGGGSSGCWGVWPYFPSGTIIASNISAPGANNTGELYVITPDYKRACYLEGQVTDAITGFPIPNVSVEILNAPVANLDNTSIQGVFKMGQESPGYYMARIFKGGYQLQEVPILLERGKVTELNVALFPDGQYKVGGIVMSAGKLQPYDNAIVYLYGRSSVYTAVSGNGGLFEFPSVPPGIYDVVGTALSGASGMMHEMLVLGDTSITLFLAPDQRRPGSAINPVGSAQKFGVYPNPSTSAFNLEYDLPEAEGFLQITNAAGQLVATKQIPQGSGVLTFGEELEPGVYFIQMNGKAQESSPPVRLVKY